MRRLLVGALVAGTMLVGLSGPASAAATKSFLYHDGDILRTVVNPAPIPGGGNDPFYSVVNGVEDQLGIAGVAPGDPTYNGGAWAVNLVEFDAGIEPYLLTSDEEVFAAEAAGDVTVTRAPDMDFRCPVFP
jgi:hypothetical protein